MFYSYDGPPLAAALIGSVVALPQALPPRRALAFIKQIGIRVWNRIILWNDSIDVPNC